MTWNEAFHEHRAPDVLISANETASIEAVQDLADAPFVPGMADDFQRDWLLATSTEHNNRAVGFQGALRDDPPDADLILDSLSER